LKTHTSCWQCNSPRSWVLKARVQDGGRVLATIEAEDQCYTWRTIAVRGVCLTYYAAQRKVRKALADDKQ
jgi:hypothetical protein